METLLLIPREEKFITFKYYFKDRIFTASFRFESLSITFLDSLLVFIQWQWSTFVGSNIPFTLSNNFRTLFPRFLDSTEFVICYLQTLSLRVLTVTPALSFHIHPPAQQHFIYVFSNNHFWSKLLKIFFKLTDHVSLFCQN